MTDNAEARAGGMTPEPSSDVVRCALTGECPREAVIVELRRMLSEAAAETVTLTLRAEAAERQRDEYAALDCSMQHDADRRRVEAAEAALAALRETLREVLRVVLFSSGDIADRARVAIALRAALSSTDAAAEAYRARVRAEALREAADDSLIPQHAAWRLRAMAEDV